MAMAASFPRVLAFGVVGLALASGVAACAGSRGAVVQAPVELAIAPVGNVPNGGIATSGERTAGGGGQCSLRLVASRIEKSSPGCYLDQHISRSAGVLHYPCSGDGPVEVGYGENRYVGRVAGGEVELELTSELDWEDGCRWGTRAIITGTLTTPKGEPAMRSLSWRYRDHVITGTSCSGVCTATATIPVTSMAGSGLKGAPESDEDEDEDDSY